MLLSAVFQSATPRRDFTTPLLEDLAARQLVARQLVARQKLQGSLLQATFGIPPFEVGSVVF